MHDTRLARAAREARQGTRDQLASALQASRQDTLATFECHARWRPDLAVPLRAELNPPLWELGHVGWFQEYWIARNPSLAEGVRADPHVARRPGVRANADALYDSSHVPHDSRWQLPLPGAAATRDDLARQFERTLALLREAASDDDSLYFFRLALLHEDMHHEAALYMARGLGLPLDDPRWHPRALPEPPPAIDVPAGSWRLGRGGLRGFAFDNELSGCEVSLAAFSIDAQAVRWAEFLPFVESGGYDQSRWWSDEGLRWRAQAAQALPRYLRRGAGGWEYSRGGRWESLDPREAACHLSLHEAQAWCCWASRRLPTEAEWERALAQSESRFAWGDVWEWTASPFAPFPGFQPHPYRDYSAPWFDGRPVLKGASCYTQPRMRDPVYRNFFPAARNDVPAGFRSCAI